MSDKNIRVYHDEESGKLVGLDADGNKVPIEYESISTEEETIVSSETGDAVGTWDTKKDPHPYDGEAQTDYVTFWQPNPDNANFSSLGLMDEGGIMYYDTVNDEWHEMLKLFGGNGPVLANEVPGASLVFETEDLGGSDTGGVDIRTGFPGDKRRRFRVENDTTDADTDTIGPDDKAYFDALEKLVLYGLDFKLFTLPRQGDGSEERWLDFAYNNGADFGRIDAFNGRPLAFQSAGTNIMSLVSDGVDLYDDNARLKHSIHSSAPSDPEPGDVVIADGTNWDPDGDGNAEKVIYNGNTWVEDTDLQTAL